MKTNILWRPGLIIAIAVLFASCKKEKRCHDGNSVITTKVFATGLNNPRGLKFGPDGKLYVAEGGTGGGTYSKEPCKQVLPPIGPYTGSATGGRISWISSAGVRHTLTDQLPTSQDAFGSIIGVGDVAFIGNTMYALITGGGCSHGNATVPNSIIKVAHDGTWSMVANLSEWLMTHPAANPEEDFEPDGSWYSMDNAQGDLYAIEANQGQLVKVTPGGHISRVVDISASQGHIVPTSVSYNNGNFFVGNLNPFPIVEGSSKVYKITPGGNISVWASGFSIITGVAFDKHNRLYVLENTTGNPFPTPGTGRIIRVNKSGTRDTIASGLSLPTAMTFGPDGKLYVSSTGFGPTAIGGGEILQINLKDCEDNDLLAAKNNEK